MGSKSQYSPLSLLPWLGPPPPISSPQGFNLYLLFSSCPSGGNTQVTDSAAVLSQHHLYWDRAIPDPQQGSRLPSDLRVVPCSPGDACLPTLPLPSVKSLWTSVPQISQLAISMTILPNTSAPSLKIRSPRCTHACKHLIASRCA